MSELEIHKLISDLALILGLGAVATIVFKKLKQPVVLGYIVAGFIASPHFAFFSSVANESNIEFWAQIGIIVLLFSLGLEFSFKKLVNVGGSAIVTAGIIVLGMIGLGFMVGKLMGYDLVNSIFLGGMMSMSSTTIIIKALTDLNMRQRRFVPMIFAVLVVEDLIAVVLMVVLSGVAVDKSVEGGKMIGSIISLSFFLVMWFTVGIFLIPAIFKHYKRLISDEMMLIISMGLCFLMAILSVEAGFSLALGAFVMGSILAGTVEAKRIEHLVSPIKDLFGAVFFISVGMMVDPNILVEHAGTIALLSVVVIVGMITFGTFGMLATGQPLKNAIESGFTLTQIGEFSFIIASLGTGLGVLKPTTYPIIVAVSVITTFTTPFFIKQAEPCYSGLLKVLPARWIVALSGYSDTAQKAEVPESRELWKKIIARYLLRLTLYFAIMVTVAIVIDEVMEWGSVQSYLGEENSEKIWTVLTILCIIPFLWSIMRFPIGENERRRLVELTGKVSYVPIVLMETFSFILCTGFMALMLSDYYNSHTSLFMGIVINLIIVFALTPMLKKRMTRLEHFFIDNANQRENHRTGKNNTLVSDMHLAYITVEPGCPFAGEQLRDADLRRKYGVNVVNIERRGTIYPVPKSDMRVFPGDVLGVIGTEKAIERLLPIAEKEEKHDVHSAGEAKLLHIAIKDSSPIVGMNLKRARLREDYSALLVAVQRDGEDGEPTYLSPTPDITFVAGDVLWLVADPATVKKL